MPHLQRFVVCLFIALAISLSLTGCKQVAFRNTITGVSADSTPLVGRWIMTEFLGVVPKAEDQAVIEVGLDEGQVRIKVTHQSLTTAKNVLLTNLGTATLFSFQDDFGLWHHFGVMLEDGGQRLVVRAPDFDQFRQDVQKDTVAGEIRQLDIDEDDLVIVDADSTDLSKYIAANPDLFRETFLVLEKE